MDDEFDYQKYLKKLQTVKKEDDIEVLSSNSDDFQMEKQETQYSQQPIYHSEVDEFVIPPKEQDSVSIDTKPYESIQIVKPKIQPVQLPSLSKKLGHNTIRKFFIKNVEINQQMLKYETIMYEIESYINESDKALVIRQYSDFEWLFEELFENFPGIIIPSIPGRTLLAKLNISNYTNQIRAQRQIGLEEFLRKVLTHQKLLDCEIIEKFLTLQDQDFKKLMQTYQQIKLKKQSINVSQSVVVSSIGKLSGLFFNQKADNEMEKYCSMVWNEINTQKFKVKAIRDSLEKSFLSKNDQSKYFLQMATVFEEIVYDANLKDDINQNCEITHNILKDSYQQVIQLVYVIDQYLLDFEVIFNIVRYRQNLQQLITDHAAALNNAKYTPEQIAIIQGQLNDHYKSMSKLVENFKSEYEDYSAQFNQNFNSLIQNVITILNNLNQFTYQTWN